MDARDMVRRLESLERKLDDAPGRREYDEFHDGVERQFEDIKKTVDALRNELAAAISTRHADWRQMVYAGLVPFAIGIVIMLLSKGAK